MESGQVDMHRPKSKNFFKINQLNIIRSWKLSFLIFLTGFAFQVPPSTFFFVNQFFYIETATDKLFIYVRLANKLANCPIEIIFATFHIKSKPCFWAFFNANVWCWTMNKWHTFYQIEVKHIRLINH